MQYFEEEQRFRQPWIWAILLLSLVVPLIVFGYAFIQQLILNEPFGDKPASDTGFSDHCCACPCDSRGLDVAVL